MLHFADFLLHPGRDITSHLHGKTEKTPRVEVAHTGLPSLAFDNGNIHLLVGGLLIDQGPAFVLSIDHFWLFWKHAAPAPNALNKLSTFKMSCLSF